MANPQKLYKKAEKLLHKQKLAPALEIFHKLFELDPQDESVLLNIAEISQRLERQEDSIRYNMLLANLYTEWKDFSRAAATYRKILKMVPDDAHSLTNLAEALTAQGKTDRASAAYQQAAVAFRKKGDTAKALDCLNRWAELEPENLQALAELAALNVDSGRPDLGASIFLKAANIARCSGLEEKWADMAERAHQLDPSNTPARVAAAEVYLARCHSREAIALLEPLTQSLPKETITLKLLCQAYLDAGEFAKAEPLCLELGQSHADTLSLAEQLVRGFLTLGQTAQALTLLEGIKEQMCKVEGKRPDFLALVEQIYRADENNVDVLELLPPLYNEANREGDLRRALTRLFNLYLAGELYDKAADTLEGILDVDPYGAGHSDRLLNLEGHLDETWYNNIASRVALPGVGRGLATNAFLEIDDGPPLESPASLEDLIVEAEMYHRYHVAAKLEEILKRIDRFYPGAHHENDSLKDLYELAGFQPSEAVPPVPVNSTVPKAATLPLPLEELGKLSAITAVIHRQGTPDRVLSVAAEQLCRLVGTSRCWIAAGPLDSTALTAEYVTPRLAHSDPAAALKICTFLSQHFPLDSEGWSFNNVMDEKQLETVGAQIYMLGICSLLAIPLMDKEQMAGFMLLEECQEPRDWTLGEKLLARTVASQVTIAINSTRLRRLVRSLAGTDQDTGLLPRSAYLDCLLAEATRAEEQSRPMSLCLLEPANAADLSREIGDAEMQPYIQQLSSDVSAHLRQNDIAVRYGPYTIALCLPDTPLAQSKVVIEKLQTRLRRNRLSPAISPDFCATVADLYIGLDFDAADAVTEVINRLETSMEAVRSEPHASIHFSRFQTT